MTSFPAWGAAVSLLPALVMLALAVRELLVGERESVPARVPSDASRPAGPEESAPGSVETVQQAQRLISHAKSETEFSFVPLFLGVYGAGALAGSEVVGWLAPSAGAFTVLVSSVVAVPCLLALWPLYRIANRWIGGLQRLLDRQVGELTRLETEFLWRFAGTAVPE